MKEKEVMNFKESEGLYGGAGRRNDKGEMI